MKKACLKIFILLASLAVSIAAGELLLRKFAETAMKNEFERFSTANPDNSQRAIYPENSPIGRLESYWDPYIGFRYVPNQTVLNKTINEFGFSNKVWTRDKPDSVYRIVLMGGSVCEGLADSETISRFLEDELKKDIPQVEVLNCALTGMMSTQERILFMNEIIDFKPDMVVFLDGVNELMPLKYNLKPGEYFYWFAGQYGVSGGQPLSKTVKNLFIKMKLKLIEKSVLFRMLCKLLKEDVDYSGANIREEDITRAVDIYFKNVDLIRTVAAAKKIKTVFFLQPVSFFKDTKVAEEKFYLEKTPAGIKNLFERGYALYELRASGAGVTMMNDVFNGIDSKIYTDHCHVIPEGNRLMAIRMKGEIMKNYSHHGDTESRR